MASGIQARLLALLFALLWGSACGTWVGNPSDDDDDEDDETNVAGNGSGGGGTLNVAGPGAAFIQPVTLRGGVAFTPSYVFSGASLTTSGNDVAASGPIEISIVAADGTETVYDRKGADDAQTTFTPEADGEFTVIVKNNTSGNLELEETGSGGAETAVDPVLATSRDSATSSILLKAVVAFAKKCQRDLSAAPWSETVTAPAGKYFAQPIVFLGKVDGAGRVDPISTATVKLTQGDETLALKKLSDFDVKVYKEMGGLTDAQHAAWTRTFYQGYFGAAGELYTVDTFRMGGDCAAAPTFTLGDDPGVAAEILLTVEDDSLEPKLSTSAKVRATASTAFTMYTASDAKLKDYTQCTYDRTTGDPKPYNGDGECKTFKLSDPPYVTLDYQLPSGGGLSAESDPTRIVFYGHSYPKAWYEALIEDSEALIDGDADTVSLPGCLNNGGLVAVPVATEKTFMPLAEFNVNAAADGKGDVINLARKAGSYTALTDFYQGNVDASGEIEYAACIPKGSEACHATRVLKVQLGSCQIKADSGVTVTAVGDSMIYPSYFEMSGIVAP
jgi:hypothetical protein